MRCMPDWETCKPLVASIRENLELIWTSKFMTMTEYRRRVEAGALVKSKWFCDDRAFQKANPDHPLAGENRYARIKAADAIRDASRQINRPLPSDTLADVHKALFDCCAAVRHSLAQALFFVGGRESIPVIERLLETEPESNMVRSSAKVTLDRCKMRASGYIASDAKLVIVVSPDLDLIAELLDISKRYSFRLLVPDPPFDELTTMRGEAHIVDRWYMGREAWDYYCDYLDSVAAGQSHPRSTVIGQESLLPESTLDDTPLIVTDWRMDRSVQEFRNPNKPEDSVFLVTGGPIDVVALIVEKAMTGTRPISFDEIADEVNARRLAGR